jgi:hypothetical protein
MVTLGYKDRILSFQLMWVISCLVIGRRYNRVWDFSLGGIVVHRHILRIEIIMIKFKVMGLIFGKSKPFV